MSSVLALLVFAASPTPAAPADGLSFERVLIDDDGPRNPWVKVAGDFDGDGRTDIAIGGQSGPLVWYEQPSWEKRVVVAGGYRAVGGAAGDIDRDGDVNIAIGGVLWYENAGRGGGEWRAHSIGDHVAHDVEVADLDGDGRLDVVTRNQSGFGHRDGDRILVWKQDSADEWRRREIRAPHGEGLALGDLDGDGDRDIAIAGCWFEAGGGIDSGAWTRRDYSSAWQRGDAKVAIADLDGDGRPDIVLSPAEPQGETGRIAWFEAPVERRTEEWRQHVIQEEVETVVHALAAGDVDGDGRIDVVTAEMHQGADPDEVAVHINGGGGARWERHVVATSGSHNVILADLDRDGDLDIAGANHGGPHQPIELWRNRGAKAGER